MQNETPEALRGLPPYEQLVEVMRILRSDKGCPWDRAQDHQTLTRYLLEETYESLEAIEQEDFGKMSEELGDLLLQIVFHAQLAREAGHFDMNTVCQGIVDKMVRRHPHVFAEVEGVDDPDKVLTQWEQIKRLEGKRETPASVLAGLPKALPSLHLAERMQSRAAQVGFEFASPQAAWAKLAEELGELEKAAPVERLDEMGDVLFACVSLCRMWKIDPERALRSTCEKFRERFEKMERELGGDFQGRSPEALLAAFRS